MTPYEKDLWKKLTEFSPDEQGQIFNFSDRLARDNGWTKAYALEVITEYKKFLFLCAITTTGVTPSDAVDQAWHLHLTYTRSYRTDLCGNILGKDIQHNPTKGGDQEATKYLDYYEETLAAYREKFGEEPPAHIWPVSRQRFSDIDFVRVNKRTSWVISKPTPRQREIFLQFGLVILVAWLFYTLADTSWRPAVIFSTLAVLVAMFFYRVNGNGNETRTDTGSSTGGSCSSGCTSTNDHGHSGCSGCAASGCSGCSGCGGGGGD